MLFILQFRSNNKQKRKSHKRLNFIVQQSFKPTAYDASLIQSGWLYFFVELQIFFLRGNSVRLNILKFRSGPHIIQGETLINNSNENHYSPYNRKKLFSSPRQGNIENVSRPVQSRYLINKSSVLFHKCTHCKYDVDNKYIYMCDM